MFSKLILPFAGLVAAAALETIKLRVPPGPAEGRQVIDPSYHAFSIEFSSFVHYTGNSTYLNKLNANLPKNLREIAGIPLYVRVGGGSQNVVTWIEDQEEGHIGYYTRAWTKPTTPPLVSLAIGNEWGGGEELHPERTYSPTEYIERWSAYAQSVADYAFGDPDEQIWQIGSFHSPTYDCQGNLSCWTTDTLLQLGINKNNITKTVNTHQYMEDAWRRDYVDEQFLMNHNNTQGTVDWHRELAANASGYRLPYELGETSSLSGHGKKGVSGTYAATLWMIDYVFYSAQTEVSKLYMHQGTGWKYSAWNPITAFDYPSGVLGTYYAYLFSYTALSGGNKQVELLVGDKTLVAYAIYNTRSYGPSLSAIAAVNLEAWETASDPKERPSVDLKLPPHSGGRKPKVLRLTGPGTDVKWGITFAGQGVDEEGKINGPRVTEEVRKHGIVSLAAAEAVLITL